MDGNPKADNSTPEKVLDTIVSAINRQDFETVLQVCVDDVLLVFAGQEELRGKRQLINYFNDSTEKFGRREMQIEITDKSVQSTGAWILTSYQLVATKSEGANQIQRTRGRSLTVYEYVDGSGWLLSSEMVDQITE